MTECTYCDQRAEYVIHDPGKPESDDIVVCITCAAVFAAGQKAPKAEITKHMVRFLKNREPTGEPRAVAALSGQNLVNLLISLDMVEHHKP